MKKLLILLTLGLMFGQTKLETRLYDYDISWGGSLTQLQAGSGYWFKSSIEACFNYECAEN